MSIQRWDAMREFEKLHEEVDRLFRHSVPARTLTQESCSVAVDILENEEEVVLRVELPGVKADDVAVRVEDSILTIEGEKKLPDAEAKDAYLRIERFYGKFQRAFTMPNYVDPDKITAEHKDGILTLRLPKRAETKPRSIEIKVG